VLDLTEKAGWSRERILALNSVTLRGKMFRSNKYFCAATLTANGNHEEHEERWSGRNFHARQAGMPASASSVVVELDHKSRILSS
jgi:hypothetical protein